MPCTKPVCGWSGSKFASERPTRSRRFWASPTKKSSRWPIIRASMSVGHRTSSSSSVRAAAPTVRRASRRRPPRAASRCSSATPRAHRRLACGRKIGCVGRDQGEVREEYLSHRQRPSGRRRYPPPRGSRRGDSGGAGRARGRSRDRLGRDRRWRCRECRGRGRHGGRQGSGHCDSSRSMLCRCVPAVVDPKGEALDGYEAEASALRRLKSLKTPVTHRVGHRAAPPRAAARSRRS